jgi:GNAT superfamily N-acetyltransferase
VIIKPASPDDVDVIMSWRRERVAWLAQRGADQWSIPLPRSAIAATVLAGQTWMVWDGDDPVGTITLAAASEADAFWKPDIDPEPLWHPEDRPLDALYAAKMMVPRNRAGAGLGSEMLAWAGGRAYLAGLTWLRFDAWSTNADLHAYYVGLGYEHVRTVSSRVSGACFQRPAQPYIDGRLKTQD